MSKQAVPTGVMKQTAMICSSHTTDWEYMRGHQAPTINTWWSQLKKASNIATAARELTADQWHHIYLYSTFKKVTFKQHIVFNNDIFKIYFGVVLFGHNILGCFVMCELILLSFCVDLLLITWMHCQTYSWSDHAPKMSDQEEHEKAAGVVPKSSTCHHSVALHMDAHILILELCTCWED